MTTTYTIHNVETGEIEVIQFTPEQETNWSKARQEAEAKAQLEAQAAAEAAAAKAALLEKLGITEEEAKLLLGGN